MRAVVRAHHAQLKERRSALPIAVSTPFLVAAIAMTIGIAHAGGGHGNTFGHAGAGNITTSAGNKSPPTIRDHRGEAPQGAVHYCRYHCQPGQVPTGPGWNGVVRDHR